MNILMLSTDRSVFEEGSAIRERLKEQGALTTVLHVIVLTPRHEKFEVVHLGRHVIIHPTLSTHKIFYVVDAFRLGVKILKEEYKKKKWLITAQDPFEVGAVGYMLARKFSLPLHLQVHTDPWSAWWKGEHVYNRVRYLLAHFLLHRAEGIRVVSLRVKNSLCAIGIDEERITQIPIFVDVRHFSEAVPTFDLHSAYPHYSQIVLSIGRLQPEKNFHGLIRAFKKVREKHNDALLIIVGSGPERERLLALARSLDLEDAVKILPWARDVATYYKTCTVYVQPSLYEGWGLSVIEALASGCPVIMTDVGCAGEVVKNEESGIVIPVGDENVLAHAIERILDNNAFALSLAERGHAEVKKLATKAETTLLYKSSWEKTLAKAGGK